MFILYGCAEPNYDFRSLNWGMSIKDVKAKEKAPLINEEAGLLTYEIEIASVPLNVQYRFEEGKLYGLLFDSNDMNDAEIDSNEVKAQYDSLFEEFSGLYGTPINYEDNTLSFSIFGTINIKTIWQSERSEIQLWLIGTNWFTRYYGIIMPRDGGLKQELEALLPS